MKLVSNGFKSVEEIISHRFPVIDDLLSPERDPLLAGLDDAVRTTIKALNDKKKIFVIGDYDVDGVTSCVILNNTFKVLYGIDAVVRIPKRMSEGYGLNMSIVDEISEQAKEPALIFTVDNGIVAVKQVEKLKDSGHTVIIIDHHLAAKDGCLPPADAIIDPKVTGQSDFSDYCGAGLSLRFIKELVKIDEMESHPKWELHLKKMTALATLGTIADSVPMLGDNRNIVKDGLTYINERAVTSGLFVLMQAMRQELVNEKDVGFYLAPALNAVGRLKDDGAMDAFLMLSKDRDASDLAPGKVLTEAMVIAKQLVEANEQRKTMVNDAVEKFNELVDPSLGAPIVVCDKDLHEGIVGIIAGKLAEEYHMPAFVFTESGDLLKGSARTYGDINVKKVMDEALEFFEKYGGHAAAAGMSIKPDNLESLTDALRETLKGTKVENNICYDMEITPDQVDAVYEDVKKFAPYGTENPEPVILINGFKVKSLKKIGKKGQHMKLSGEKNDVLAFEGTAKWDVKDGDTVDIVGNLSGNTFRGEFRVQVEASMIKKEGEDVEI